MLVSSTTQISYPETWDLSQAEWIYCHYIMPHFVSTCIQISKIGHDRSLQHTLTNPVMVNHYCVPQGIILDYVTALMCSLRKETKAQKKMQL